MTRQRLDGPGLLALVAALLLMLAAAQLALPIRLDVAPRAPTVTDGPLTGPSLAVHPDDAETWREAVVASNLFSSSRRAPTDRFRLPGLAAEASPMAPPAAPPGMGIPGMGLPAGPDDAEPVLVGLVRVNGRRQALITFASPDSAARLVGPGARVGRYQVRSIEADRVELRSPDGPRTLRLPPSSLSDSSESTP